MKYEAVIGIFNETGLSPEDLAQWIGVSNSTYRRWQKAPPTAELPQEYQQNVTAGIYKLLGEGKLQYDSTRVSDFIEHHIPEFFQAAAGQFQNPDELYSERSTHQDKVTTMLSQLGSNAKARQRVDKAKNKISKFSSWGNSWKERIQLLSGIIVNKEMALIDRLVAYGALFYLILPFDLIPDAVPVFGYVDDFGILGFAAAYYTRRFPHLIKKEDLPSATF